MRSREERLHMKHEIGIATGIDPDTGRKYRPPQKQKKWYPPSGAAGTAKGREKQEALVGFGEPKKKRKKRDGSPGGDDDPPGPGLPVSRTAIPRVKVEEHFTPDQIARMTPAQMSPEARAAYQQTITEQRRTAVPTVDPAKAPVAADTVLSAEVMDEPQAKRPRTTQAIVTSQYAPATAERLGPQELTRRARMQPAPKIKPKLVPVGARAPGVKWLTRPETYPGDQTPAPQRKRHGPSPEEETVQVNANPTAAEAAKPNVLGVPAGMPPLEAVPDEPAAEPEKPEPEGLEGFARRGPELQLS